MRIWDVNPGYLNRQSLLGEHRELHAVVSIITNHKKGYAHHPETLRWVEYGWALQKRHQLLAAEMALRGYNDRSPVELHTNHGVWPESYVDLPGQQFEILTIKYRDKEMGRIPLPLTTQQLWSQHKYSVLARDVNAYKILGKNVSALLADAEINYHIQNFSSGIGLSYLSGNSKTGEEQKNDHLFDLLYGARHRFFGAIDYFSNIKSNTKEGGLADYFFNLSFKTNSK